MTVSVDGTNGITYPLGTGVMKVGPTLMTAQNTTSGTSIDFTGIPAGVKRITVMLNGVSFNANANPQIQIGAGSIATSGYTSAAGDYVPTANFANHTSGFVLAGATSSLGVAGNNLYGQIVITNITGNTWCSSSNLSGYGSSTNTATGAGTVTLSGQLDRLRITSTAGTAAFDAGSVNLLYE